MSDSSLLMRRLATSLYEDAHHVPTILGGGVSPLEMPIPGYIKAQGVLVATDFHLPEPILHPVNEPLVLVVGFNPNFGPGDDSPRFGDSLESYIRFYENRFAPERRDSAGRPASRDLITNRINCIEHYDKVERLVAPVVGTPTALGLNTVYCDSIPWKWKQESRPPYRKKDGELAFQRLEGIVLTLRPKVILTLGSNAAKVVGRWTRNTPSPNLTNGNWPAAHVAAYHPAARGNAFSRNYLLIQKALESALNGRTTGAMED